MAEIGLVPFARLALKVATAVLSRYRTRFSKHQFTQPQLLAILCLMRYEDWTFREAEVRLREHAELRRALGLHHVPEHTTMCRFLFRLPEESIGRALGEVARRCPRLHRNVGLDPSTRIELLASWIGRIYYFSRSNDRL